MSYTRVDASDFAKNILEHYEKHGHQVFVDFDDIKPGANWEETIRNSIAESDIVAVIVTRSALRSPEVEKEVLEARKQNKTIIPCRYRGISWTDLKWDLNKLQGFEFDNENSLIRKLDDIIFSKNNKTAIQSLSKEDTGEKPGTLYRFSSKKSIIIISITIISIIAITGVVIGMVGFPPPSPPVIGKEINEPTDKIMPPDVNTLFAAALSSYNMRQYSDAVDSFNKVLQIEPNNVTAQFLKGSSLYEEAKYSDAVDSFNKVLQIEPNNVTAQFLKGLSLYNAENYNNAHESFKQLIQLDPNNTKALYYDGLSLYNLERYNDAISEFNGVLELEPSNTNALLYKGLSLYNLERYNEAIMQFNRVLALEPSNTNVLLYKGLSLYNLERYDEAVAYYDRVLEIDPNNINATKEKERTQQIQQNQSTTTTNINNN